MTRPIEWEDLGLRVRPDDAPAPWCCQNCGRNMLFGATFGPLCLRCRVRPVCGCKAAGVNRCTAYTPETCPLNRAVNEI
jgi:hypothetical protein